MTASAIKSQTEVILEQIKDAKYPEDLFGIVEPRRIYIQLQKFVHPDKHIESSDTVQKLATEASALLNHIWATAAIAIDKGEYGERKTAIKASPEITFASKHHQYKLATKIHTGGTCAVFEGSVWDRTLTYANAIIRIPHSYIDNDLMQREAKVLSKLREKEKYLLDSGKDIAEASQQFARRLPIFIESIKLKSPSTPKQYKVVNTFMHMPEFSTGWYNLEQVRTKYYGGIDARHAVWIWRRVIEGMTFAHGAGVIHDALTPQHIIIHPESHLAQIVDWTSARIVGEDMARPYSNKKWEHWYPPEGKYSSVRGDIYQLACTILYLLGGDPFEMRVPYEVPETIKALLNICLQPKARMRICSMSELYNALDKAAETAYGPRKFIPFTM